MRAIIQRVTEASVTIEGECKSKIGLGFLILLGIEQEDTVEDVKKLSAKISKLRIFSDAEGKMNLSVSDVDGELLVVSQFTLYGSVKGSNRPSFIRSARPEQAIPLYELFNKILATDAARPVQTGEFGADMKVALLNDGPVTLILDTKEF